MNTKSEMDKLAELLEKDGVAFERFHDPTKVPDYVLPNKDVERELRNQIVIKQGKTELSFICHLGSYGVDQGLIECYDFKSEPVGYLTANECMEIVKEKLK